MKKQHLHLFQGILSYAAADKKFHKALVAAVDTAPSTLKIDIPLSSDDARIIKKILSDLGRVSKHRLDPCDVKSWAIGVTEIRDLSNTSKGG